MTSPRCPRPLWALAFLASATFLSLPFAAAARAEDPPAPPPEPGMGEPGMGEPAMDDPGMGEPGMDVPPPPADPGMAEPAPAPVAKCDIAEAIQELERLKGYLKNKKADNGDITASMDAVMKCYKGFLPADDSVALGDAEKKYLNDVEKELLDALLLTKVRPNTEANDRDDVNIKAAQLLGQARPGVTKRLVDAMEGKIFKAKDYKPAPTLTDEAFKAVGLLNNHKDGLDYVIKEYTAKLDNTAGRPERIKAAWDSLVFFKDVPALKRYEVVKNAVKTYVGPEHQAEINKTPDDRAKKEVWDKIKGSVVKAVQAFAKDPKDPKSGNVLATMKGIEDWFRDNDKMGKEPWTDAKPTPPPPGPAPAK